MSASVFIFVLRRLAAKRQSAFLTKIIFFGGNTLDKFFKISERGSNVRSEIIGGLTTFFAMAYIIFVNPMYLSMTGMSYDAVMIATCISAAIGCFLTAFIANVPFAQAPGMGLNTYFTFTIVMGMGYTWQQALGIVFISGLLFLIITISPLRSKIIESIPAFLKNAISAGIGMFIAFIGLFNAKIIVGFDTYTDMGAITGGAPLLALIGLLITAVLLAYNVKGAIFIGIIITTIIGIPMGITDLTMSTKGISAISETFLKLNFTGILEVDGGIVALLTAIISFAIVDCFDTVGTLVGTATSAGLTDKNGNLPGGDKALIADAVATCTGALCGTSTVTTFVESSTGISDGARTGLSSVVVGIMFLVSMFFVSVASIVPSAATAPALILVGVFMLKGAVKVDWSNMEEAIPAFLTIAMMPFAYSISDGIAFGLISFSVIKLARGKAKEVPLLVYILSVLFIISYIMTIK